MSLLHRFPALCLLVLFLGGCAFAPVIPPRGILLTDQKAPMFSGRAPGSKEGRASTHTVLFLVAWGDASIQAAAQNGGLKEIRHLNYELFNFLGIYQRFTTVAQGE